jgi:uncharacterized membrane protein YkoI
VTERRRTIRFSRSRRTVALGVGSAVMLAALGVAAQHSSDSLVSPADPGAVIAQRSSISLAQATAMAQRLHRGRVVGAETMSRGGRLIHEIRILGDDGRVRTVRIDAETGEMQ